MIKIIVCYSIINAWLAGNYAEESIKKEYKTKRRKIIAVIINQIFMLLFGSIFLVIFLIINQLKNLWIWIECTLQLKFWYRWYSGYYNELPSHSTIIYIQEKMRAYNNLKKLSLAEKHFIYCAKVLFKKFNINANT